MGHPEPSPSPAPLPWWLLGRTTLSFILDIVSSSRGGGDILNALISSVIVEANLAPLQNDLDLARRYATLDSPPPDELRRPISINAVAASLRLPYETVRRRVSAMIDAGFCVATPRGVYIPMVVLQSSFYEAVAGARHERLRRFYFELKALGAFRDMTVSPDGAEIYAGRPPVRASNRAIAEYVLRVCDRLMQGIGDPLTGLILFEMTRANAEATAAVHLTVDAPLPDTVRVPINNLALARRLGLPPETVRRHVAKLDALGFCRKVKGGRLAALEQLGAGESGEHALAENLRDVQRLFARCAALGIVAQWEAEGRG